MENQPFPSEVTEWTWETVHSLSESEHPENLYLEYKQYLEYPDNEGTSARLVRWTAQGSHNRTHSSSPSSLGYPP